MTFNYDEGNITEISKSCAKKKAKMRRFDFDKFAWLFWDIFSFFRYVVAIQVKKVSWVIYM